MAVREHEREFARLQSRLTGELARLGGLRPGSPEWDDVADQVIAAGQELVAHEERMPRLVDQEPRRITLIVLRTAGAVTMAVAAAIALSVAAGRAWWWLPIAVVLAVAGARLLMARVRRAGDGARDGAHDGAHDGHLQQRLPAGLVLAGALAAGLGDLGVATLWVLMAGVVLVAGGLILLLPTASVAVQDLATGTALDPGDTV